MSVRLYGRTVGHGSLAVVTAGFQRVFGDALGMLEGVYSIDRSGGSDEDDDPPGAMATHGVFVGNLNHLPLMQRNAQHKMHWVMVTPNSTYVPPKLLDAVVRLPEVRILTPSGWGQVVLEQAFVDLGFERRPPIHVVKHGVQSMAPWPEELSATRADYASGYFRVVHFSTSDGQRKGTLELLQAWGRAKTTWLPARAELLLVLDHHARQALQERLLDLGRLMPQGVKLLSRADMHPEAMSRFLCQQHLLAAPSRGEGFGFGPIESRASGVPCIATQLTGHSAGHVAGAGVVRIAQDDKLHPIDDGPAALAPRVDPQAIDNALNVAYEGWLGLSQICEALSERTREEWSWENQLQPLIAAMALHEKYALNS